MRHADIPDALNDLAERVIGCAIEVHRHLGPGLIEAAYEKALIHELSLAGIPTAGQVEIPLSYKGVDLPRQRLDLIVDGVLVLELKALARVEDVHLAQLVSYLRAGRYPLGLLINFNTPLLSKEVYRRINPVACSALSASSSAPPRSNGVPA
jgi:GxxExxY protein